jgi:hypothetical protein
MEERAATAMTRSRLTYRTFLSPYRHLPESTRSSERSTSGLGIAQCSTGLISANYFGILLALNIPGVIYVNRNTATTGDGKSIDRRSSAFRRPD